MDTGIPFETRCSIIITIREALSGLRSLLSSEQSNTPSYDKLGAFILASDDYASHMTRAQCAHSASGLSSRLQASRPGIMLQHPPKSTNMSLPLSPQAYIFYRFGLGKVSSQMEVSAHGRWVSTCRPRRDKRGSRGRKVLRDLRNSPSDYQAHVTTLLYMTIDRDLDLFRWLRYFYKGEGYSTRWRWFHIRSPRSNPFENCIAFLLYLLSA